MTQDQQDVIEALVAPSFQQDSQWHHAKANYATKPRDLLAEAASLIRHQAERLRVMEGALKDTTAHLVTAISLLKASPKTGAASDKMFDLMVRDYGASAERARAALTQQEGKS